MKTRTGLFVLMLTFLALSPLVRGQTPAAAPGSAEQSSAMPAQGMPGMQGVDKMSDSVTKMSEMCQMMMQKEMAAMPFKIGAGIVIGVLLFVALVLFIVLEIQWIKYWNVLLKRQRETEERTHP